MASAIINGFASADGAIVKIRGGGYELPFGHVYVTFDPSALEWHNRRSVALTPVETLEIRGLANRYRHAGIGAPLAASTEPIVAERGMQVAPRMKLPVTALLRLDAPRRQLAQKQLHAELNLYNTFDVSSVTVAGRRVPIETDESAVLAYTLAPPEIWAREPKALAVASGVCTLVSVMGTATLAEIRPRQNCRTVRQGDLLFIWPRCELNEPLCFGPLAFAQPLLSPP
jgi:hypothetical protein